MSLRVSSKLCVVIGLLGMAHVSTNTGFGQAIPPLLPGWQTIVERPDLSPIQQEGARFAAQHLPVELFNALPEPYQDSLLRYAADYRDGKPTFVLCWERHTPETIVKPFLEIEYAGKVVKRTQEDHRKSSIATAYQADDSDHWSRTASDGSGQGIQGLPITLTWSIVPDGTIIPGGAVPGEGSNEPSNLRARLAAIYGGSATDPAASQPWFPIFQAVFDNIAAKTGVRYVYEPNDDGATLSSLSSGQGVLGVRGDVRISGHALDGNSNVLAYDYFPNFSEMVIDTADNFFDNTANNSLRLRNVVEHEHLHGLGVSHVCPVDNTKLMEPYINLGFIGVQFDDIFTVQRLYGDFLEVHGSERSNDSFQIATPINPSLAVPYAAEWLGIDDDTDTDYFSFSLPSSSLLTIRVIPSTASYLEGAQNQLTGSCSAGTTFDSSALQDLGLTLYAPDQSTVLGVATSQPAGATEEIMNLPIPTAGTYYARVTGSGANVNQLYRLEVNVGGSSYVLQLSSANVVQEIFPGGNGAPDPGETVRLNVTLENVGQEPAPNLTATLTGPAGFQGFEVSKACGTLPAGASTNADFTFALNGACGELFALSLDLNVDGSDAGALPIDLMTGTEAVLFHEGFESGNSIPAGWSNTQDSKGSLWSVVSSPSNPGQNSAFAADVDGKGQSTLTTPSIALGSSPTTLSFVHFYDTEANWDGGVLEIQIGAGTWQDILSAGGTFLSGGYDSVLGTQTSQNPLKGRNAWSGDSGTFLTTEVALPAPAANQTIHLRWILGHDQRVGANGWYIEQVNLTEVACESGSPLLSLSSEDDSMSEYSNVTDTATVTVSAGLPVATDLPVTLNASGSADPGLDMVGFDNLLLSAGHTSTSLVLTAVSDGLVEGNETLTINSPDATGSVQLTVLDTPYAQLVSSYLGTVGPVNPFDDFDDDGSINVEELTFGSDLASSNSQPLIQLHAEGNAFKLPALLSSLPEGILVEAESSTNLQAWTTNDTTTVPDGFLIPGTDPQRFLRLKYDVRETAP